MNSAYSCSHPLESIIMLRVRKYTQFWRILCQNCSDDSTEVTEGVTSTPEIFANKHSCDLSLPFLQQIQFMLIVDVVNLN